jgi:hypothetical protein
LGLRRWTAEEEEFLVSNAASWSDVELADKLGRGVTGVAARRRALGITYRPWGRHNDEVESTVPAHEEAHSRKEFVRENYLRMTDGEMARELKIRTSSVGAIRQQLKLFRPRKRGEELGVLSAVDPEWLRRALCEDGKTLIDVAKELGVSKEMVRLVREDLGIPKERSPRWYFVRRGVPELAEKDVFEKRLRAARSMYALARETGISPTIIRGMALKSGVDPHLGYNKQMVEVVCAQCGAKFERSDRQISRSKLKLFFCDKTCYGRWFGLNHGHGAPPSWTKEQDEFLRANYLMQTDVAMARALGKHKATVRKHRKRLGLVR